MLENVWKMALEHRVPSFIITTRPEHNLMYALLHFFPGAGIRQHLQHSSEEPAV